MSQPHAPDNLRIGPDRDALEVAKGQPLVRLQQVCKRFGRQEVLRGATLEIRSGERLVILGRSGGGKSVLLRLIMGLVRPDSGEVFLGPHNLAGLGDSDLTPLRRHMGMLFQNGALFDSLNVFENVAFPLREQRQHSEEEITRDVAQALKIVSLEGQEKKMPASLSGGMRKRVALARAAISRPRLMLYDEPTAGLDPIVADSINKLIVHLSQELSITSVIVTHDIVSALAIADRLAMLHEGKIYKVGTPEEFRTEKDPVIYNFLNGISDKPEVEWED